MDGTLWDSRQSIVGNWNEVLIAYGLLENPLKASDMNPYMGSLADRVLRSLFPDISEETIQSIMNEIVKKEADFIRKNGGILYKHVKETLPKLKEKHQLYIVSNCNKGYIEAFLDYYNFHNFFTDFEEYGRTGKPKSENIRLLMERNNLKATQSIYIGDTLTDYKAAKSNELDFVFCEYGFGEIKEENIRRIQEFKQILSIGS